MKTLIVEQKDFPEKLKKIENAPKRLFYIGNIKLLYEDCFAIVGTRRITKYGIKICEKFSKEFALRDIPIVSGMAIGTDSIAHKNVLIYPQQNCNLFKEIIEKEGLILSEYDNNVPANKDNFPLRNRIVSAISEGVLVIEAAWRSGTTITANYANKQGKLVFAIPGNLDSTYSQGVNILIKNGAMLTTSIEDILINYPQFMNKKRKEEKQIKVKKEYKQIYKILENGECTLEYLLNSTNLEIKEMLHILSNMEFEGIIFKEIGVYKLNE